MDQVLNAPVDRKQNRGFILGSLTFGHGISHLYDQGFPIILPAIRDAMGLGNFQVATLLAIRQVGFGVVNLGGGVLVDRFKRHWGLILTGCMLWSAISYLAIGASPNFALLVVGVVLISWPGALWHLPSTAAISQRFPDKRGFAVSMHGFGSNIGNVFGPIMAGGLLTYLLWRHVLFIYAGPALLMALFVWWSLKDLGRDGQEDRSADSGGLSVQLKGALAIIKNPVVIALILAASVRGIALGATFNWTPFYLEEADGLNMTHFQAGYHYALLTGMGIISAPILGWLSGKYGRKIVLVPGMAAATVLLLLVVSASGTPFLLLVFAGMGLFSFALHQIILAAALDIVGRGSEATAVGLIFGVNGMVGAASPFIATLIIDHLGGYGSIFYYAGALTAVATVLLIFVPMPTRKTEPVPVG